MRAVFLAWVRQGPPLPSLWPVQHPEWAAGSDHKSSLGSTERGADGLRDAGLCPRPTRKLGKEQGAGSREGRGTCRGMGARPGAGLSLTVLSVCLVCRRSHPFAQGSGFADGRPEPASQSADPQRAGAGHPHLPQVGPGGLRGPSGAQRP